MKSRWKRFVQYFYKLIAVNDYEKFFNRPFLRLNVSCTDFESSYHYCWSRSVIVDYHSEIHSKIVSSVFSPLNTLIPPEQPSKAEPILCKALQIRQFIHEVQNYHHNYAPQPSSYEYFLIIISSQ